jgi:hypothetical protein
MFPNVLHESNLVKSLQSEYLNLINYYTQVVRPSVFIKYFNISLESVYNEKSFSTYDSFIYSNIFFDLYDLTPAYFIQALNNRSDYSEDKAGMNLDSNTVIAVNTLKRPKINDLIMFYQPFHKSKEIFKVINLSTSTVLLHANTEWFELELDYAPIEDVTHLKISNHYVYDLSIEDYITYEKYTNKINKLNQLTTILDKIKPLYHYHLDVYTQDNLIPLKLNNLLYDIKKDYSTKYKRILDSYKTPLGLLNLNLLNNYNHNQYYDYITKEIKELHDFQLSVELSDFFKVNESYFI